LLLNSQLPAPSFPLDPYQKELASLLAVRQRDRSSELQAVSWKRRPLHYRGV